MAQTLLADLWAQLLQRFGIPGLNLLCWGAGSGIFTMGSFFHVSINQARPISHELILGWLIPSDWHFTRGIVTARVWRRLVKARTVVPGHSPGFMQRHSALFCHATRNGLLVLPLQKRPRR